MAPRFRWTTFDLNDWLPSGWREDVAAAAAAAEIREFPRTPVISRESPDVQRIARGASTPTRCANHVPWLYKAYRNEMLELANEISAEHVSAAETTDTASCSTSSGEQACGSSATSIPTR